MKAGGRNKTALCLAAVMCIVCMLQFGVSGPLTATAAALAEGETELKLQIPDPPTKKQSLTYDLNFRYADSARVVLIPDTEDDADNHNGAQGMFYLLYDDQQTEYTEGTPYVIRDGCLYLRERSGNVGSEDTSDAAAEEEKYWGVVTDIMLLPGKPLEIVSGMVPEQDALFEAQLDSHTQKDGEEVLLATVWFHENGTFQYANFMFSQYNSGTYRVENGYVQMSPGFPISGDSFYIYEGGVYTSQFLRRPTQDTP